MIESKFGIGIRKGKGHIFFNTVQDMSLKGLPAGQQYCCRANKMLLGLSFSLAQSSFFAFCEEAAKKGNVCWEATCWSQKSWSQTGKVSALLQKNSIEQEGTFWEIKDAPIPRSLAEWHWPEEIKLLEATLSLKPKKIRHLGNDTSYNYFSKLTSTRTQTLQLFRDTPVIRRDPSGDQLRE